MGHWGTEIFDNDAAADLRGWWDEMLAEGQTPAATTRDILSDKGRDWSKHPDAVYALVSLQMDARALEPGLARTALMHVESELGEGCATWKDAAERVAVLEEFRQRVRKFLHELEPGTRRPPPTDPDSILY